MRNFNTSFVKNAVRFFVNEASHVLRASTDLAAALLRLIQSDVRRLLEFVAGYRLSLLQPKLADFAQGKPEIIGRFQSAMPGNDPSQVNAQRRWDCRLSSAVS